TATATDPDLPANTLTFTLSGTVPEGAAIGATSGVFTWTPTEAQGPGDYTFQVRVTDDGGLYDEKTDRNSVGQGKEAPTRARRPLPTAVHACSLRTFTATATDPDLPANTLTFSLSGTVPEGAAIDASTGVFTWTPTEAQGPGDYTFQVRVTDDGGLYDEK